MNHIEARDESMHKRFPLIPAEEIKSYFIESSLDKRTPIQKTGK